jgi:hypothetical protein
LNSYPTLSGWWPSDDTVAEHASVYQNPNQQGGAGSSRYSHSFNNSSYSNVAYGIGIARSADMESGYEAAPPAPLDLQRVRSVRRERSNSAGRRVNDNARGRPGDRNAQNNAQRERSSSSGQVSWYEREERERLRWTRLDLERERALEEADARARGLRS